MEATYRQIIALLLGTSIALVAFGFNYSWHSQFTAFVERVGAERSIQLSAPPTTSSDALRRIALTYCARQLDCSAQLPLQQVVGQVDDVETGDVMVFFRVSQQLTPEQLLDAELSQRLNYKMRLQRGRYFQLEVNYD